MTAMINHAFIVVSAGLLYWIDIVQSMQYDKPNQSFKN